LSDLTLCAKKTVAGGKKGESDLRFLSDTSVAYCDIEELQTRAFAKIGSPANETIIEHQRQWLKQKGFPDSAIAWSRTTRLQEPLSFILLKMKTNRIEQIIRDQWGGLKIWPALGTLPIFSPNAETVYLNDAHQPALLVSSTLMGFLDDVIEDLAASIPIRRDADGVLLSDDQNAIVAEAAKHPQIAHNLECSIAIFLGGQPLGPKGESGWCPKPTLDDAHTHLAQQVTLGAELFLVAHEYGHIIDGDIIEGLPTASTSNEISVSPRFKWVFFNWKQELMADYWGWDLMIKATTPSEQKMADWGPDILFTILDYLNRAIYLARTGTDKYDPATPEQHQAVDLLNQWEYHGPPDKQTKMTDQELSRLTGHPPNSFRRAIVRDYNMKSRGSVGRVDVGDSFLKAFEASWPTVKQMILNNRDEIKKCLSQQADLWGIVSED
jgi:hypothetical protein